MIINRFAGEHRYLSNFYPCDVTLYDGEHEITGRTAEHVYQAAKAAYVNEQAWVLQAETASDAKRRGREITCRPEWDQVRKQVMLDVVLAKFTQHPGLAELLTATAPARLVEGNTWDDRYWGTVNGEGANWLGRILMMTRDLLAADPA
jgi:ribA/ribD-fused uncharacterized protein